MAPAGDYRPQLAPVDDLAGPGACCRALCSAKSSKSLTLKVASGNWCARQHAAIQLSLAGRGRPGA
jgi:hypothetical protein